MKLRFPVLLAASALAGTAQAGPYEALGGEPDGTPAQANELPTWFIGASQLSQAAGEVDYWSSPVAQGDLIFAYVYMAEAAAPKDSTLHVYADDGTTLIEFDDDDGPGLFSVVAGAAAPQTGNVYFAVSGPTPALSNKTYFIFHAEVGPEDVGAEIEDNDSPESAMPVYRTVITGEAAPGDVDYFKFYPPDGRFVVMVDDDPEDDGALFDSEIELHVGEGEPQFIAAGDNEASHDGNAVGGFYSPWMAPEGPYYVRIANGGSSATTYRFVVLDEGDPAGACGNGTVYDDLDGCDDDNMVDGDGCSSTCAEETGFACGFEPSICVSTCGDGIAASDEACDDGNTIAGDGCSPSCAIEPPPTDTGTETASETASETETETETGSETQTETASATDTAAPTDTATDTTTAGTDTDTDTAVTTTETETGSATETTSETETETASETSTEMRTGSTTDTGTDTSSSTGTRTDTEVTDPNTESDAATSSAPSTETADDTAADLGASSDATDEGCACAAPRSHRSSGWQVWTALAIGAVVARRRGQRTSRAMQ